MAFKFVAVFALFAVAHAGFLPATQVYHTAPAPQVYHTAPAPQVYHAAPAPQVYHAAPAVVKTVAPVAHYAAQPVLTKVDNEFDPHPQYKYAYNVQDSVSGDSKSQVEERDGDAVRGEYSLIDADGYKRTVTYTADDHNGFNAVVHREPLVKTVVAPVAHYAAPTVVKAVAPIAHYAAPVGHYVAPTVVKSVAPVAHYAAPAYTTYSAPSTYVHHH